MSVTARVKQQLTVTETLETGVDAAANPNIVHDQFNVNETLNATSTVPATTVAADTIALSSGALTIDLTSLNGTNGVSVDGSGLNVQAVLLSNASGNTGAMTFVEGATNGHPLFGASFSIVLQPGDSILAYFPDSGTAIGSSNKTIDVTGTGTESFDYQFVMG